MLYLNFAEFLKKDEERKVFNKISVVHNSIRKMEIKYKRSS